jgi:uncharacterized tellurite resistance protein B-like protein
MGENRLSWIAISDRAVERLVAATVHLYMRQMIEADTPATPEELAFLDETVPKRTLIEHGLADRATGMLTPDYIAAVVEGTAKLAGLLDADQKKAIDYRMRIAANKDGQRTRLEQAWIIALAKLIGLPTA